MLLVLGLVNWLHVHWREIVAVLTSRRQNKRKMGETSREEETMEEGRVENNVESRKARVRPRLELPSASGASSSNQIPSDNAPSQIQGDDVPRAPRFPPPPSTLQPRWAPWSPEWFLYWMAGRVTGRLQREEMTEARLRAYEQRRRLLGATLAALDLDHSRTVRMRAHEFCFNMTDLSPRDDSPEFFTDGEETLPVDNARSAGELIGGEDQGYFDPDNIPWRNYGTNNPGASRNEVEHEDGEHEDENESGESEHESEDTRVARYLHAPLDEVSDQEMWMNLHHWSSASEDNESDHEMSPVEHTNDETATTTNNGETANEPRMEDS